MSDVGTEFVWWFGVVEDRADPLELGRVRVRCYGYHTEDLEKIPTTDLPWAQPIQDITSAAIGGVGRSATGLLEGTWVVGFFADGSQAQRPMIMGSLAGWPTQAFPETPKGFFDPTGTNPKRIGDADTPLLAREEGETDETLQFKRGAKVSLGKVPTATAPDTASLSDRISDADYAEDEQGADTRPTWEEPNPRYGGETDGTFLETTDEEGVSSTIPASAYPYNHVTQTESGHIFEVDDTESSERIHQYHKAGTFEEIQPDGTRVTKVVGSDYEVVVSDQKIYIQGNQTITVVGDCKLYVQGNHYTEIDKNQYVTVRGDRITKIQGNDIKEVMSDESIQINGNKNQRVSGDRRSVIDGNYKETVGKDKEISIKKNELKTVFVNQRTTVIANTATTSLGNLDFAAGTNMSVANGGTWKHVSVGAASEEFQSTATRKHTGKSSIDYNGDAHIRYDADYYKHVGADTHTYNAAGVDHTQVDSPTRTGAVDVTSTTVDNL